MSGFSWGRDSFWDRGLDSFPQADRRCNNQRRQQAGHQVQHLSTSVPVPQAKIDEAQLLLTAALQQALVAQQKWDWNLASVEPVDLSSMRNNSHVRWDITFTSTARRYAWDEKPNPNPVVLAAMKATRANLQIMHCSASVIAGPR